MSAIVPAVCNDLSWLSKVTSAMQTKQKIVLVVENQTTSGFLEMVKKLRKSYGKRIGLISIEDPSVHFDLNNETIIRQLEKNLDINIFKMGVWGGYYYIPAAKSKIIKNVTLTNADGLDKLSWIEAPPALANNRLIQICSVTVHYASVSSEDLHKVSKDLINANSKFGIDFSGVNSKSERVMGLVQGGALSSTVEADPEFLWPVPSYWSLEDAATVPLPYLYAYYCLSFAPQVEGSRVFINGGSEALGQAIIAICISLGCTVYVSVHSKREKKFLQQIFPELDENNIIATNDDAHFMVILNSNNKGCDIVINCFNRAGFRETAMKCVGYGGCLLDISENETQATHSFGMSYLVDTKYYVSIALSSIFKRQGITERKLFQYMLSEGIAKGVVRPLSRVVYSPKDINTAFKHFSSKNLNGKVLIRITDFKTLQLHVSPRLQYSPEGTHIVISDANDLSIEVADRLVKRGARKIVLNISNLLQTSYIKALITSWKKLNTQVVIVSKNLQTEDNCWELIEEARKFGHISGIFIVNNFNLAEENDNYHTKESSKIVSNTLTVMKNLDLVSKKACTNLENFVVINFSPNNETDEYIVFASEKLCESRKELSLPALAFRVNLITEFCDNMESSLKTKPQRLLKVFNALETGIKLNYTNVTTFDLNTKNNSDFLQKIAKITGIKNIKDIEESLCFNDWLLDDSTVEKIKAVIKEESQVEITTTEVRDMNLASLKHLNDKIKEKKAKLNHGLGVFYEFIDEDECFASEPVVQMPTKLSNTIEEEYEINPNDTYLMLIPGFEGHHHIFTRACERLKIKALTFQLGPDTTGDSIKEMASNLYKLIQRRFKINGKFYLLGYSFGVNVALELASILEKDGLVGVVYCLDSSPDALKAQIDTYLGKTTDIQLQNMIVEYMYNLISGSDSEEISQETENKNNNWSKKVEFCVYKLRGHATYSNQYKKSLMESAYKRIKLAREYQPEIKLRSKLILMKGIPHANYVDLPEDYNLSKHSIQPVKVVKLESDHVYAPYDCRVSNIINRFLDSHLLEQFNSKSLCDNYVKDSNFDLRL